MPKELAACLRHLQAVWQSGVVRAAFLRLIIRPTQHAAGMEPRMRNYLTHGVKLVKTVAQVKSFAVIGPTTIMQAKTKHANFIDTAIFLYL